MNLPSLFVVLLLPTRWAVQMCILTRAFQLVPSAFRFLAFSQVVDFGILFLAKPILVLQSLGLALLAKAIVLTLLLILLLNLFVQVYFFVVLFIGSAKRIFGLGIPDDPINDPQIKAFLDMKN